MKVGDKVTYFDRTEDQFYAFVTKVNPKTVDINVFGKVYRVDKKDMKVIH